MNTNRIPHWYDPMEVSAWEAGYEAGYASTNEPGDVPEAPLHYARHDNYEGLAWQEGFAAGHFDHWGGK